MNSTEGFKNILIVGLGLIGGSIAKKLKDISYSGDIYGLDRDPRVLKGAYQDTLVKNDSCRSLLEYPDMHPLALSGLYLIRIYHQNRKYLLTFWQ